MGQSKRKKLALGCAVTTLAILGATAWQLVEAVRALIATDNTSEVERIVFAIVQVTAWGLCLAGTAVVLSCLRLRRPTRLVLFASCSAIAVIVLQVALIVLNFVLIAVWQNHISNSCASWRFDVIWMERRTCVGAGTAPAGYFIAAAIRLIVVLLLSVSRRPPSFLSSTRKLNIGTCIGVVVGLVEVMEPVSSSTFYGHRDPSVRGLVRD